MMTEQLIQITDAQASPEILIRKHNVIMDATVLTALMACERYLDLRFNQNIIPISGTANPLEVGQLVHKIMEVYNLSIIDGKIKPTAIALGMEAGAEFYKTAENIPEENEYEISNKILKDGTKSKAKGKIKQVGYKWIVTTMEMYFNRWKNDSWVPLEAEKVRGAVVFEDDDVRVLWKAKLDTMVDTYQDIMPGDYKTMKQLRNTLSLNNQFMGQCLIAKTRKMFVDKIGFQKNLEPNEKFVRQVMSYGAEQLAEQVQTIGYYAKYLVDLRNGGFYPPRYTHCDKYNGCMYRRICESQPSDRDRFMKLNFKIGETWDPVNSEDIDD